MFVNKCIVCLVKQTIGYGIIAVTFGLQPLLKWACDYLTGFWRLAVADVFLFLGFVGTANVWRGLWAILDIYFIPGRKMNYVKTLCPNPPTVYKLCITKLTIPKMC